MNTSRTSCHNHQLLAGFTGFNPPATAAVVVAAAAAAVVGQIGSRVEHGGNFHRMWQLLAAPIPPLRR